VVSSTTHCAFSEATALCSASTCCLPAPDASADQRLESGTPDGGADGPERSDGAPSSCAAAFTAALVKTCATAADCQLVKHDDCCGTQVVAIKSGTQASFASAEQTYRGCVPGCGQRGCFHADLAEEGGSPGAGQTIVAECRSARCLSVVRSEPAACATNGDCGIDRLCVAYVTNVGPTSTTKRQCRANPCGAGPLACSCAGSLCAAPNSFCSVREDQVVCDDGRQ
jgi:hypothetical protein